MLICKSCKVIFNERLKDKDFPDLCPMCVDDLTEVNGRLTWFGKTCRKCNCAIENVDKDFPDLCPMCIENMIDSVN